MPSFAFNYVLKDRNALRGKLTNVREKIAHMRSLTLVNYRSQKKNCHSGFN